MTGQRSAFPRLSAEPEPGSSDEPLSKILARLDDLQSAPAEPPEGSFPPVLVRPERPARPKKIALEFEPRRPSRGWRLGGGAAGLLVLAGAVALVLQAPGVEWTGFWPQPRATQSLPRSALGQTPREEPAGPSSGSGGPQWRAVASAAAEPALRPDSRAEAEATTTGAMPAARPEAETVALRPTVEPPEPVPPPNPAVARSEGPPAVAVEDPPRTGAIGDVAPAPATQVAALAPAASVSRPPAAPKPAPGPEIDRLVRRGLDLIRDGDFSAARLVLERAMSGGSAQAAFHLAQTYDPRMLSTWQARGIKGDSARARELYQAASEQGVHEARERIAELD